MSRAVAPVYWMSRLVGGRSQALGSAAGLVWQERRAIPFLTLSPAVNVRVTARWRRVSVTLCHLSDALCMRIRCKFGRSLELCAGRFRQCQLHLVPFY